MAFIVTFNVTLHHILLRWEIMHETSFCYIPAKKVTIFH